LRDRRGRLIAFEGTEGAGKSSHLTLAAAALRREGHRVQITREPGGTPLGRAIRQWLLHPEDGAPAPFAELLLYLADRAQHVREVIEPALAAGAIVLTDRFSASTIAYQGYGRGLDLPMVRQMDAWARGGVAPDLNLLLDCPVRIGLRRARGDDRFHRELDAFHERVRQGFLALAAATPGQWRVIDATAGVEHVQERVWHAIRACVADP
jgi:dTMP kinase